MNKINISGMQIMFNMRKGDGFSICKICYGAGVLFIKTDEEIRFMANDRHKTYDGDEDKAYNKVTKSHVNLTKNPPHDTDRYRTNSGNFSCNKLNGIMTHLNKRYRSKDERSRKRIFGTLKVRHRDRKT
eukprot:196566_1